MAEEEAKTVDAGPKQTEEEKPETLSKSTAPSGEESKDDKNTATEPEPVNEDDDTPDQEEIGKFLCTSRQAHRNRITSLHSRLIHDTTELTYVNR